MSDTDDFVSTARAATDSAKALADRSTGTPPPEQVRAILEAIEGLTAASAKLLTQVQGQNMAASGELPPLEELTRLLTQSAHRARIVRNRFREA